MKYLLIAIILLTGCSKEKEPWKPQPYYVNVLYQTGSVLAEGVKLDQYEYGQTLVSWKGEADESSVIGYQIEDYWGLYLDTIPPSGQVYYFWLNPVQDQ